MKASRQAKLEIQLAAAETSLLDSLGVVLPRVTTSGEMLFFNSEFLPDGIRAHWLPQESEILLALANECVELREKIGLPVLRSVGQLYLSACGEAANTDNANRRGPRQLAAWLLSELGPNNSFKPNPHRGGA